MTLWNFQRDAHPILFGLLEGLGGAAALLVLSGATGWMGPMWCALLLGALASHRAGACQASAVIAVALVCDIVSGNALGVSLAPLGAGLLAANLGARQADERWRAGHAWFALLLIAGSWTFSTVSGLIAASVFGPAPGLLSLAGTLLFLGCAVVFVWVVNMALEHRASRRRYPLLEARGGR
ncbi:hypothetical protein HZA57_01700 [Candidatus Poribacteria bacterium]|nr:hypothetical protein [Candidatus Poribacteria bacterium]